MRPTCPFALPLISTFLSVFLLLQPLPVCCCFISLRHPQYYFHGIPNQGDLAPILTILPVHQLFHLRSFQFSRGSFSPFPSEGLGHGHISECLISLSVSGRMLYPTRIVPPTDTQSASTSGDWNWGQQLCPVPGWFRAHLEALSENADGQLCPGFDQEAQPGVWFQSMKLDQAQWENQPYAQWRWRPSLSEKGICPECPLQNRRTAKVGMRETGSGQGCRGEEDRWDLRGDCEEATARMLRLLSVACCMVGVQVGKVEVGSAGPDPRAETPSRCLVTVSSSRPIEVSCKQSPWLATLVIQSPPWM